MACCGKGRHPPLINAQKYYVQGLLNYLQETRNKLNICLMFFQVSEITFSVSGAPELRSEEEEATAVTSHTSVVHVSSSGVVTAHNTLGAASVLVRSLEDYGLKQMQPVSIQVSTSN